MIEVRSISKSYGAKSVLTEVSFQASDGAVTGFVGPNGAGKSTLLRTVAGLTRPDKGDVLVDGRPFSASPRPGTTLGVFLSAEWIPAHMTANSYIEYVCGIQGAGPARASEVLEMAGLTGAREKRVKTFSLGMRQRLGIAAAIVGRPQNLILDEPINGLDPDGIQWLRSLVTSAAAAGGSVLLSSHHMGELAQVADSVVMLDQGRVVRSGSISTFTANVSEHTYAEAADREAAMGLLRNKGYSVEAHGMGFTVDAAPIDVGRVLFGLGAGASHLRLIERSLEETYFDEIAARTEREGAVGL